MADKGWTGLPKVMSADVITATIRRIAEHAERHSLDQLEIGLHGGEPLLAGPRILADIATELRRTLPEGTSADLTVQTNGTQISAEFLDVFRMHQIRVGVSLDGIQEVHDRHRRYANGQGSHAATVRGLRLLSNELHRDLFAGLLCVIDVTADPVETYEALLEFQPPEVNFLLPHGNWSAPPPRRTGDEADTPYGDWLITVFDRWYGAPSRQTGIRLFDEIINLVLGGASRTEGVGLSPVALITVNTDGAMEQVDALRSAYHGAAATNLTVLRNSFDEALRHPAIIARQIGLAALSDTCLRCPIRDVCGGGHYVHRYRSETGFRNPSVYCPDLRRLITHIRERIHADLAGSG